MLARFTFVTVFVFSAVAALIGCSDVPPQSSSTPVPATPADEEFSYAMYNDVLQQHVNAEGFVDYASLKAEREPLDRFIAALGSVNEPELQSWSTERRLAFWMNAYNAITLKYIIDNYPIKKGGLISGALYPENSIRQIDGVWTELTTPVAGTALTLDHIEHEILRKDFKEPRIHMAINCASIGCPPLRSEAFVAERLDEQLDDQTKRFLTSPDKFRIDRDNDDVYLSPIFDWFGEDFVPAYAPEDDSFADHSEKLAAVLNFVSGYVSETDAHYLRHNDYDVAFSDYDWSLNEQ